MICTCPHLNDVRESLAAGHWPAGNSPELRDHVAVCRVCADHVAITQAFQSSRAQSLPSARLVPASIVFWRAQLRRRHTALEAIARPVRHAQLFALATILLLAAGFVTWLLRNGDSWRQWFASLAQTLGLPAAGTPLLTANTLLPLAGLAALVTLGGVVVYLAWERE